MLSLSLSAQLALQDSSGAPAALMMCALQLSLCKSEQAVAHICRAEKVPGMPTWDVVNLTSAWLPQTLPSVRKFRN